MKMIRVLIQVPQVPRGQTRRRAQARQLFAMTLRYAHLSPMHLRTAVESLDGLRPPIVSLDPMAYKMAQSRSADATADASSHNALIS